MQRTTNVTVALLFVAALAAALVLGLRPKRTPEPTAPARASAAPKSSASAVPSASSAPKADAPEQEPALVIQGGVTEGFESFPDGGKVPELPASAPARIGFGAVIFTYRGAQGAPGDARSKEEAKKKATETIEVAQKDFAAAVAKGDRGSTTDAGRLPRGVIEPPIEYVLFTLEKGKVHPEPVDTPRGYWVVRRNE
jgi:PPIC-type peptidyl-prolyl cis-trans isomerase-like protein